MKNEDVWTGLGALLSTILSGLAWLYEIGALQTLFTFLTGALVTFYVESKLQDRSEKRRLRVKAIEELHIPLYLEVEKIRDNLLLDLDPTGMGVWLALVEKPQMFTLKHEFRGQLLAFFEKSQKIAEELESVKRIAAEIIYNDVKTKLFPVLCKEGIIEIEKAAKVSIDPWKEGTGFGLHLKGPAYTFEAPVAICAIGSRDPIAFLENNHKAFEVEQLVFFIKIKYQIGVNCQEKHFEVPIMEKATIFRDFWRETTESIQKNPDIQRFSKIQQELIPVAEDILKRLDKHIKECVTTEKI